MYELNKYETKHCQLALCQAEQSPFVKETGRNFRHGAVLYNKSTVINAAYNQKRYSSFSRMFTSDLYCANVHAEIGCILNIPKHHTQHSNILVVRINPKGEMRNSKPCDMCMAAMMFAGIKSVVYSTDQNKFDKIRLY